MTLDPWTQARRIDPTVKVSRAQFAALDRRRLQPVAFSRDLLFSRMAKGEPVLFDDLPVPVRGEHKLGTGPAVQRALAQGFPHDGRIVTRCGPSGTRNSISAGDLLRRWNSARSRVSVTDFHIRGTGIVKRIDCSRLSDFNLLARAGGDIGVQEMLTMVVSSAQTFTDSHSDDPDGSNHCFAGRKLWLVWDTFRGLAHNLGDVERQPIVTGRAAFSMAGFLSIPGSRWFTVGTGQTLFLPGHLSHKVVTLEDYLGIGSFFVMLPSYWRTLLRWTRHTPLWALDAPADRRLALVDRITRRVTDKVTALAHASERERALWGVSHLHTAAAEWQRTASADARAALLSNPASAALLKAALNAKPYLAASGRRHEAVLSAPA